MNKQTYADKHSLNDWKKLCQEKDFVEAFWGDDFELCDKISDCILYGKEARY